MVDIKSNEKPERATKSNEKQQKAARSNKIKQTPGLEKIKTGNKNQNEQQRAVKLKMETRLYC